MTRSEIIVKVRYLYNKIKGKRKTKRKISKQYCCRDMLGDYEETQKGYRKLYPDRVYVNNVSDGKDGECDKQNIGGGTFAEALYVKQ